MCSHRHQQQHGAAKWQFLSKVYGALQVAGCQVVQRCLLNCHSNRVYCQAGSRKYDAVRLQTIKRTKALQHQHPALSSPLR